MNARQPLPGLAGIALGMHLNAIPAPAADTVRKPAEPLLTPAQSTLAANDGLGGWITAPIETALRDIDDEYTPSEGAHLPFLAARLVVLGYRQQAYGRHTQVWLDYGQATGSLTAAKAREVLAAMRGFCDKFEALVALAEETAAGDFDGDPEIARLDREAEDRRINAVGALAGGVR